MWQDASNEESLWEQLHQLSSTPLLPDFTREFYGLMVEFSAEANDAASRELTWRLLEVELRYYRQLQRLEDAESSSSGLTAESAEEKRGIALELLYERARGRGFSAEGGAELVRQLVMAECAYHLGRVDAVVAHLEQAMDCGAPHPLLYFALGYARFMLALTCFARREAPGAQRNYTSQETIRQLCLAAVTAFEGALTGGPRDATILWWIGRVLLAAGFEEAGQETLGQAEARETGQGDLLPESEIERRLSEPGVPHPISEMELSRFMEEIKRPHPLSNLL